MPLVPEVQQLLDGLAALGAPPITEQTPEEARAAYAALGTVAPMPAPDLPGVDRSLPGPAGDIPVRVYTPAGVADDGGTLVWYHGGGWVIGDLETADATCRNLAHDAGVRVVSVGYRLAPEHPYPAAADDAFAVFAAVADGALGAAPAKIAVGGDSAGGNLAAVVCLMARDRGIRMPDFQLLIYPVTDSRTDTGSYEENAEGYLLTRDSMTWFLNHYAGEVGGEDPYLAPLRATSVAGLPPALVITAEYDPLRDEGEAYAGRLADAGVPVVARRVDGQIHGFIGMPHLCGPSATDAVAAAAAELKSRLG